MKKKFIVPSKEKRMSAIGKLPTDKLLKAALSNSEAFYLPVPDPDEGDWLASHKENGQTFDEYLAYKKIKIGTLGKSTLYFLPFQHLDETLLAQCLKFCQAFFYGVPVKYMPAVDIKATKVENRINDYSHKIQYNALQIMGAAKQFFLKDAFATLSVMMDDLYPFDTWNFCYGWSEYKGGSGVFSLARYDPRFSGNEVKGNPMDIILHRACKIMTHEMTHMFGIFHCIYFKCAMNGINTDEEAAKSPLDLCPVCLRKLQYNIGFDVIDRYKKMYEVMCGFPYTFDKDKEWVKSRIDYLSKVPKY